MSDRPCTCTPYPYGDGPEVDCDVHGLPSAAFAAGYREGRQDERDQARIRGDLCRWCLRPQERGEEHGTYLHHSSDPDSDPDVGCLYPDGTEIPHRSADQAAF